MIVHPAQMLLLQGLFDLDAPDLALPQRLERYREQRDSFMLSRLICRADELAALAELTRPQEALLVEAVLQAPEELELVELFHARSSSSVRVDTVSSAWIGAEQGQRWLRRWNYNLFFELEADQAQAAATLCADLAPRAGLRWRGGDLAAFLRPVRQAGCPFQLAATPPDWLRLVGWLCLAWWRRESGDELAPLEVDAHGLRLSRQSCSVEEIGEFRARGLRSLRLPDLTPVNETLMAAGWLQ